MVRVWCAALLIGGMLPAAAHADCQYRRLNAVSGGGATVQLDDGSQWSVSDYDQSEARSWQQDATITACENELINTEVHETVQAREVKRGLPVPQDQPD